KVLLVSATEAEIAPFLGSSGNGGASRVSGHQVTTLITGVGMVATAFRMGMHLSSGRYDLAINTGIAGAFDRNLQIGAVFQVSEDCFAELGAEDGDEFLPIDKLGFGESRILPLTAQHPVPGWPSARAITVSRVHGNETTIYKTMSRLQPQIESMEGAAFFYACNQVKLPSVQLRAVSNYVERRNLSGWNIPLAVENLNAAIFTYLQKL
ncbi:MAG TPA: futalosine hydrolase, partial [Sphingobacteriaceae bacterium]